MPRYHYVTYGTTNYTLETNSSDEVVWWPSPDDVIQTTRLDTGEPIISDDVIIKDKMLESLKRILALNTIFAPKLGTTALCNHCGYLVRSTKLNTIVDVKGYAICDKCIDSQKRNGSNKYKKCSKCNVYYKNHCICTIEQANAGRRGLVVGEYNTKNKYSEFKLDPLDNLLLGLEVEIEFPKGDGSDPRNFKFSSQVKKDLADFIKMDWAYFKRDGSLARGLEIVTHPLGWKWVQKNRDQFKLFELLIEKGYLSKSTNTCGLHIHLDKRLFKTMHLFKFMNFQYQNLALISHVSERLWSSLMEWSHLNSINTHELCKRSKEKYTHRRHELINLNNPETVEVRYFRGALDSFSIQKAIEFVVSVYFYTEQAPLMESINTNKYYNYLMKNQKQYPHIYKFLESYIKKMSKK